MLKALLSFSCLCAVLAANSADKQEFNIVHQEGRHNVLVSVEVDIHNATVLASPRQTNKASLVTFYDFEHHVALYKSVNGPICYIERLEDDDVHAELVLLQKLNGAIVRDAPRTLFVANSTLTLVEIEALGGEKLLNFCKGKELRMLVKENPLDGRQPVQKRSKRSAPVRRRIQTQVHAQTSPNGDGQLAPEAWALASPDAAVARVGGGSGYAQAQSHVTVETEHENGAKGIRRMSASSSMYNSGRGDSAGHFIPASIAAGGGLGSGGSKGYTGFDQSRSAAGFPNFEGSSSSSYSSRSGGLVPVPGSKTYRYKVTYPGGYQSTSWYTGTADGSRSVIEGPTSSDPLHLTAPGSQTGGTGVAQANGPIYGASAQKTSSEFHTIGVGVGHSSGGFTPERAHQQAQHILQSSASQGQDSGASAFDESGSTGSFSTFDSRLGGVQQPYRGATQQHVDETFDRSEEPAYRQPSRTQTLQSRASEEERVQSSRGQHHYPSPSQPAANLQYPSRSPQQTHAFTDSAQSSQGDLRTQGNYPQAPATRSHQTYAQTGAVESSQQTPAHPQQPSYPSRQPQSQQTVPSGSRTPSQDETQSLPGRVHPSHQTQTQRRPSGQQVTPVHQQQQPTYAGSQQLVPQTLPQQQTYTQTEHDSSHAPQTLPVRVPQQTYIQSGSDKPQQTGSRTLQQPGQIPRVAQQTYSQSGADASQQTSQTTHVRVPQQTLHAQTGSDVANPQIHQQQPYAQSSVDGSQQTTYTQQGRVPQQQPYAQSSVEGSQQTTYTQQGRVPQQQPYAQSSVERSQQTTYTQQGRVPQQQQQPYEQSSVDGSQQTIYTQHGRVPQQQPYAQSTLDGSQQTTYTKQGRVPQQPYAQSNLDGSQQTTHTQQGRVSQQQYHQTDSEAPHQQIVQTSPARVPQHHVYTQSGRETSQQMIPSVPSRAPQQQTHVQTSASDARNQLRTSQQQLPSGQYLSTDTVHGQAPQHQQVLNTQSEGSAHSQRQTQQHTLQRHYDGQVHQASSSDGTSQQVLPSGGSPGQPGSIHITQQQSVHVYGSHGDRISTQQGTVGLPQQGTVGLPQQGQTGTRVTLVGQAHQVQDGQTTQTLPGYLPRQSAEAAVQGTVDSSRVSQQTLRPVYETQGSLVPSQPQRQGFQQTEQTYLGTNDGQVPQRVQQPTQLNQPPSALLSSAHSMHMEESDMLKMQPQAPEQPLTHAQAGYILPQLHYRPAPQPQQPQQPQVPAPLAPHSQQPRQSQVLDQAPQLQQPRQSQVPDQAPQPQQSRVVPSTPQQPADGHIQVTSFDPATYSRRPTRPLPVPAEGQIIQQDAVNVVRIPNGRDVSHGSQIVLQPGQAVPGTPYSVPEGLRGTVIQHNIPATGDASAGATNLEAGSASALIRPSRPTTHGTSGSAGFIGTSSLVSSGRSDISPDSSASSDSRRGAPRVLSPQPGSPQRTGPSPVPAPRQDNVPSPTDLAPDYDYEADDGYEDGTGEDDLCTGPDCSGIGPSITRTTTIRQTPVMTIPVQSPRQSSPHPTSGMNGRRVQQSVTQTFSSHGMGMNGFAAQSPTGVVKPIPVGSNGNGNGCQTMKVSCQVAHGPTQRVRICTPQVIPSCCCDISIPCSTC